MKLRANNSLQDLKELEFFTNFIANRNISSYLEIGSAVGDTLYAAIANSPQGCKGVSIDVNSRQLDTIAELNSLGYVVSNIEGSSKDQEVIAKAISLGPYDVVFIDGDHSYEHAKHDFETYKSLAPVIILHDVFQTPGQGGVRRLWDEIKTQYRTEEFETPNSTMGYGIVYAV